jgi:hypothetical protein
MQLTPRFYKEGEQINYFMLPSEKPEGKICIPGGNSKENLLFLR